MHNPKPGFHFVSEYQSSGLPFVTSSVATSTAQRIDFPKVTRAITIRNLDGQNGLHVGFTRAGILGSNKFTLSVSSSERFEVRVKNVWLQSGGGNANFSLLGELTLINSEDMPNLTGSNDGSPGGSWSGIG